MGLKGPEPLTHVPFEMEFVYNNPDGSEFGRSSYLTYNPQYLSRPVFTKGYGYKERGNWKSGKYKVEISINKKLLVRDSFYIVE